MLPVGGKLAGVWNRGMECGKREGGNGARCGQGVGMRENVNEMTEIRDEDEEDGEMTY